MFSLSSFFLIIDCHVMGLVSHLNRLDWLVNNAFQHELYNELR